jgi:hypothetical protein
MGWSSPLIVSSFYFWDSGSPLQMSREGMLRSLLWQVATQAKDLIAESAPQRWDITKIFQDDTAQWTMTELTQAFGRLTTSPFQHLRMMFFIDGLDECNQTQHEAVIGLLELMAPHKHIKLCVSSRPWTIFEDAFEMKPSLRVQDLTAHDIKIYISTELRKNRLFNQLERLRPETVEIESQVAEKASGVFLWVVLVVRELLSGLRDGDRVSDLQRRLDAMPTDLHDFFSKMLSGPDDGTTCSIERASQLLRIRACGEITIFALVLADEDDPDMFTGPRSQLSASEIKWRVDAMKRRLNTLTRGLLETVGASPDSKVRYLHRTVKDFVESSQTSALFDQFAYDPELALFHSHVLQVKLLGTVDREAKKFSLNSHVAGAFRYASHTQMGS